MNFFLWIIGFVVAILNGMLFWKIWGMTNDLKELKGNIINDVSKLKTKICNRGLTNAQLSKRVLELKYTGQGDEAKKLVDQNLMLDVFNFICDKEASIEQTKEKVGKVVTWYDKYYKILECEAPEELKGINVGKVVEEYKSLA